MPAHKPTRKPTVFVGSSVESIPVMKMVERLLKPVAQVTPWTDNDAFSKIGDYFLDSLIRAAGDFDFAILIFGQDDIVLSRKKTQVAPRDNVVFELGLFLSKLSRARTFVIAPRIWSSGLKILSDLQGLKPGEYDVKEGTKDFDEASLKAVCKRIGAKIRELGPRHDPLGPSGVTLVGGTLEELIRDAHALNQPAVIRNIALDMEVTWPIVREMILRDKQLRDITWRSLMIDHRAKEMQALLSGTVSVGFARERENLIAEFGELHGAEMARRNINFECRAYSEVPTIHGFLFGEDTVLLTLCGIEGGKLIGSPNPYITLKRTPQATREDAAGHFIGAFKGWFEHRWRSSRKVWPR
jgi:hypothetical protein